MDFLTGRKLSKAIRHALEGEVARCAVAFWGTGAEKLFGPTLRKAKIICNLKMGGTNPAVIGKLMEDSRFEVKQCDALHSKVYLGEGGAIVGSANASIGGLGFERRKSWIEAGVRTDAVAECVAWFETLWRDPEEVKPVTETDLERAQVRFSERQNSGNGAGLGVRRPKYVVVYGEPLSIAGETALKDLQKDLPNKTLGLYEGWTGMPEGADLLDFYVVNSKNVEFGYWQTFSPRLEDGKNTVCKRGKLRRDEKRFDRPAWHSAARKFLKAEPQGGWLPLDEFKKRFLR